MTPFLAEGPVFDPAKPDPIDYLTLQIPTSLRQAKPGKKPSPVIHPAAIFPDRKGKLRTADGKKLQITPIPAR